MAFRTNKVPAIEERTVSGSSVSFHSNFALPLKACKVSFSATESGTGEKSPSNPYTISGVSSLNLSANSVPVSVNFGDTYYGGYADLVRKKLFITHGILIYDGTTSPDSVNYRPTSTSVGWYYELDLDFNIDMPTEIGVTAADAFSNWLVVTDQFHLYQGSIDNCFSFYNNVSSNYKRVFVRTSDTSLTTKSLIDNYLSEHPLQIVYKLATPIEIDLSSIPDLSSIIGNNTFSTDTGTLEITFSDLQEKSASGSVASFNTILQKPLVNGEFTIEAYQEGSGDPSPVNVRNIIGWNEVNITHCGKNLFDKSTITDSARVGAAGNVIYNQTNYYCSDYIAVFPNQIYFSNADVNAQVSRNIFFDKNKNVVLATGTTTAFTVPNGAYYLRINSLKALVSSENLYLVLGSTPTSYEPYNAEVKTKQLGETVYGGSYNSVTGNKRKTYQELILNGSENWELATYAYRLNLTPNFKVSPSQKYIITAANEFMYRMVASSAELTNNQFVWFSNTDNIFVKWNWEGEHDVDAFKEFLSNNNLIMVGELAEPIESNIGATEIQTYDGANNIFCDTGDTSVVFNDLDIAKRGSFREVFKLP